MREFRAAGKKIIAYGTSFSQAQYYLAAQADEIYLDPLGEVLIEGYERYRMYYKGLLDKLAVDVHLFRVGAVQVGGRRPGAHGHVARGPAREPGLPRCAVDVVQVAPWARRATSRRMSSTNTPMATSMRCAATAAMRRASRWRPGSSPGSRPKTKSPRACIELVGEDDDGRSAIPAIDLRRLRARVHAPSGKLHSSADGPRRRDHRQRRDPRRRAAAGHGRRHDHRRRCCARRATTTTSRRWCCASTVRAAACSPRSRSIAKWLPSRLPASRSSCRWATWPPPAATTSPRRRTRSSPAPTTITGSIGIYAAVPTLDRTLDKVGVTVDGVGTTALSGKLRIDRPLDPALRDYVQLTIERGYELFLAHVAAGRKQDARSRWTNSRRAACGSAAEAKAQRPGRQTGQL